MNVSGFLSSAGSRAMGATAVVAVLEEDRQERTTRAPGGMAGALPPGRRAGHHLDHPGIRRLLTIAGCVHMLITVGESA